MSEALALERAVAAGAVAAKLMADERLWGEDLTRVGNLVALTLEALLAGPKANG